MVKNEANSARRSVAVADSPSVYIHYIAGRNDPHRRHHPHGSSAWRNPDAKSQRHAPFVRRRVISSLIASFNFGMLPSSRSRKADDPSKSWENFICFECRPRDFLRYEFPRRLNIVHASLVRRIGSLHYYFYSCVSQLSICCIVLLCTVVSIYWTVFGLECASTSASRFPFGQPNHIPSRSTICEDNRTPDDRFVEGNTFHAYSIAPSIASLRRVMVREYRCHADHFTHFKTIGYRVRQARNGSC